MNIPSPSISTDQPDYQLSCEEALDLPMRDLVDKAIQAGWSPPAVYKAVGEVIRNQAIAYEQDPDPEDDPT